MGVSGVIESIKDERISAARALATRAGRMGAGRCLIEGVSLIRQAVAAGAGLEYVLCAAGADEPALGAELAGAGVPVYAVRDGLMRKITGGAKPVGWVAVAAWPGEVGPAEPYGDFAVVCEGV